ncbi:MAG: hypothetical protein ACLFQV_02005 [Vulcanimicrobiota bacterium]
MKTKLASLLIIIILAVIPAFAQDVGPTLSGVSDQILNLYEEDGRWYPQQNWWIHGAPADGALKTEIVDENGKSIAYATWKYKREKDGWAQVSGRNIYPTNDLDNLQELSPGSYQLKVYINDEVVWRTPFQVINSKFAGEDHYYVTGPWKDYAFFYPSHGPTGSFLVFWYQGPEELSWYKQDSYPRVFMLKGEISQGDHVIIDEPLDKIDDLLFVYPQKVIRRPFSIGTVEEVRKLLKRDGQYQATVYAVDQQDYIDAAATDNMDELEWYPIARLQFRVSDGKVLTNKKLEYIGQDMDTKIITTSACYAENMIRLPIPPYSAQQELEN